MICLYDYNWGQAKLGKLWIYAKDLLENGKRPLLPAQSFYQQWDGTEHDLASMTSKILKYLKFRSPWVLRVAFTHKIDNPGIFVVNNENAKILIHKKYKNNPSACAAILAHELTHLILNSRKCHEDNDLENEKITDFATAYFGLGVLVLNGKHYHRAIDIQAIIIASILGLLLIPSFGFIGILIGLAGVLFFYFSSKKQEIDFGYWDENQYYDIFTGYLIRNNLDWDQISYYIKKGTKYPGLSI